MTVSDAPVDDIMIKCRGHHITAAFGSDGSPTGLVMLTIQAGFGKDDHRLPSERFEAGLNKPSGDPVCVRRPGCGRP
jgi:hypothetical protein